jgi:hypothetical protein
VTPDRRSSPDDADPDAGLLNRGLAAIDAVNAADPVRIVHEGQEQAKEIVHAGRMTHWVTELDPEATDAQLLAARAHHLRRWVSPRDRYPEGRNGYLRWRADHRKREAAEVGDLLTDVGYDADTVERVQAIVAKKGLGRDPQVQTHEDALCLTFLELQLDPLAHQLGAPQAVDVLRKTAKKMSPAAVALAAGLPLSDEGRHLLLAALAPPDA